MQSDLKMHVGELGIEAPPSKANSKKKSYLGSIYEECIMFMAICMAAYLGTLIRFAFQYYRGLGRSPANFSVMYANLLVRLSLADG
jgi:hypothetical protein